MAKSKHSTTKAQKKLCLELLRKNACSFSGAAHKLGISRRTVFRWHAEDEEFREEVNDIRESLLDFAESKLVENVSAGKEQSVFFMLKTLGKNRGYVEKSQLEHSGALDSIAAVNINIVRSQLSESQGVTAP